MDLKSIVTGAMSGMLPNLLASLIGPERAERLTPELNKALQQIQAGGYQNTKADLMRAIRDRGLSGQQLRGLVSRLDSPVAAGLLDRLAPGLTENLRGLGREICQTSGDSRPPHNQGGAAKFPPLKKKGKS